MFAGCAGLMIEDAAEKQEIQARMDLCKSYLQKEQPRQGLKELLAIEDRAAQNPEFHFLMGLIQMQLRNRSEAIEAFQRAVRLNPEYGQAWNNLGQALIAHKRYAEATDALQQAMDIPTYLTPEYAAYNLARLFQKQSQRKKALDYAQLALEKNQGYWPARLLLADILVEMGRIANAVEILRKGLAKTPDNVQLMLSLAENYLRLGENRHATTWFARILEQDPESAEAQVARDYLDILP